MGLFLSFIGMIGFMVMIVILIIGAFKKKGKAKKHSLLMGLFFIIFVVGIGLQPTPEETINNDMSEESNTVDPEEPETKDKSEEEKEKEEALKEEEANKKAKAEEEAKKEAEAEKEAARKKAEAKEEAEELAKKKAEEEAAKKAAEEKAAKEAEEKRKAEEKKKNSIPGTLGITAQEFKAQWNAALESFELNDNTLKIDRLNVSEGDVQGSFQTMLTPNIAVAGTINKADNSVRDILIIGQGDGTTSSGADMMISFALLVGATNPSLTADERGQVFRDLGLFDEGAELSTIDSSIVTKGVEYSMNGTAADSFGITFSAGDPEDN